MNPQNQPYQPAQPVFPPAGAQNPRGQQAPGPMPMPNPMQNQMQQPLNPVQLQQFQQLQAQQVGQQMGQIPIGSNPQLLAQQQAPQFTQANPDLPISTQSTLLISELRDSLVIMKDGSFRAVVACQSINYDLMSETERDGVEYSYQQFINSLNFTTQILIRSQRVDIGPYIERLSSIRRSNDNMLLGVLMDDYIDFIDALSQEANIMDKSFFIIIPYYPDPNAEKVIEQTRNFFKSFSKSKETQVTKIDRVTYDNAVKEINNRVESVVNGLFNIGIHSVRLNTRELASLYYNFNNPDTAVREPLVDFNQVATTYVKKGEKPTNEEGK